LLWELGLLVHGAPDGLALDFSSQGVDLPAMSLRERIAADYRVQGLSAGHHPMEIFRGSASGDGVLKSTDIPGTDSGKRVRVSGCVVCRQRPVTAKGIVFLTLEDEYGLVNVIVRPKVYERYRRITRMEPFIEVEGVLQKKDGVANVVAGRLTPLREDRPADLASPPPAPRARNFG
jgi:error-prone DNA polymerase